MSSIAPIRLRGGPADGQTDWAPYTGAPLFRWRSPELGLEYTYRRTLERDGAREVYSFVEGAAPAKLHLEPCPDCRYRNGCRGGRDRWRCKGDRGACVCNRGPCEQCRAEILEAVRRAPGACG